MISRHLMHKLKKSHVTEKTMRLAESANQYTFKVKPSATKVEIKKLIQTLFNVDVIGISTVKMKGKRKKNNKNLVSKKQDFKKAYIRLKEGQSIELLSAE